MAVVKKYPESNPTRISVFVRVYYGVPLEVLSFMKNGDRWSVGTSMAMPSDIKKALKVKEAFDAGFEELQKVIEQEKQSEK